MARRFVLACTLVLLACGGKGAASGADAKSTADVDPLALLPGSALVVATLDAHAMYASGSVGATLATFTDSLVPLGPETGFQASRDVDRVILGAYAGSQADLAVVLSGRFDVDKIAASTQSKSGVSIVKGTYAGFATEAIGQTTIVPLTAKTLVAGTTERVHLVLDRLGAGPLVSSIPAWAAETLGSQGAQFAVAADFSSQPIATAAIGSINLNWLKGLKVVRAIGDFDAPGINVAGTLSYGDATGAQAAADGMQLIDGWQRVLAPLLLGAKVQNLQVSSHGSDVSCKFALDDSSLRALLALASRYAHPAP